MPNILYLHGFASSPSSRKAVWFAARFEERGAAFSAPDLEQGGFPSLTVSSMLDIVRRAASGNKVTLIGSSLGGYLAALYAQIHPKQVDHLVLMAPAFHFASRWLAQIGPDAALVWKQSGALPMMHYGTGQQTQIGYSLIDDALKYPAEPQSPQPALVFHGLNDTVVPPSAARKWCAHSPATRRLLLYDDGHDLNASLDPMWDETARFLGLAP
jgi:hypothetical protein